MLKLLPYPPPLGEDGEPLYDRAWIDYLLRERFGVNCAIPVDFIVFSDLERAWDDNPIGFTGAFTHIMRNVDDSWDFHVYVHEDYQGGVVGFMLTEAILSIKPPEVTNFLTCVIHRGMQKLLERFFGFTTEPGSEYERPDEEDPEKILFSCSMWFNQDDYKPLNFNVRKNRNHPQHACRAAAAV